MSNIRAVSQTGLTLITGAAGFVGSGVVARLAAEGVETLACVRRDIVTMPEGVRIVPVVELTANTDWRQALAGVKSLVHLAARVHVMQDTEADPLTAFRAVNVGGTLNLARQAAAAGVKRFVFVSSIGVNGSQTVSGIPFREIVQSNPHNAYALSKWEAEEGLIQIASETGLEVVIIRPPLVYGRNAPGNFGSLMRAVQRGWPLPLGAVHNQRSLVALNNLVDFIVTCIIYSNGMDAHYPKRHQSAKVVVQ
jgi:nucleoside-diphosphate-sugar epimerase